MKLNYHTTQWLLAAGLVLGAASAHASYSVTRAQEPQVAVGMNMSQVRSAIGSPYRVTGYANRMGATTWSYHMGADRSHEITFQVDFGTNGNVIALNEILNQDVGE